MGYFARKVENVAAVTGVALGLLVIIWMSLSPVYFTGEMERFQNPLHSYITIVVGTMVFFFTGLLLTLVINTVKRKKNEKRD